MNKKLTAMQNLYIIISVIIMFYISEIYALLITEIAFLISGNLYITGIVGIALSLLVCKTIWKLRKSMIKDTLNSPITI